MNQINFVWMSRNIPGVSVRQDSSGITTVKLRPLIEITHDCTKRDRIEIIFKDDNTKYLIPDNKVLEEIYKMHISNTELMLLMHQYCESNLSRC